MLINPIRLQLIATSCPEIMIIISFSCVKSYSFDYQFNSHSHEILIHFPLTLFFFSCVRPYHG